MNIRRSIALMLSLISPVLLGGYTMTGGSLSRVAASSSPYYDLEDGRKDNNQHDEPAVNLGGSERWQTTNS
jgi:hypothetical protein